jgi:hypothetical protein
METTEDSDLDFSIEKIFEELDSEVRMRARIMQLRVPDAEGDSSSEEVDVEDEAFFTDIGKRLACAVEFAAEAEIAGVLVTGVHEHEHPLAAELRQKVIDDYKDTVFRGELYPDPPVRGPHGYGRIDLKPGARPTCAHEYRMTGERGAAAERLSWEYLRLKLCEWAKPSGWRSPLFVLKKKDQKDWSEPRGVVDHRGPNSQTERDSYCLPIIDGILEPMGRRAMWSTIDLSKAFHQVPMEEESRPITTTSTPIGLLQWCVLAMGLTNSPPQFQRVHDYVARPAKDVAAPYIDDCLVGSFQQPSVEELLRQHDKDLRRYLDCLKENKLVASLKKCRFFCTSVEFCGHVLEGGERRPAPGKLMAVERWEAPKTVTALRGFLGFANYYSMYIENFAGLAAPLTELLKVDKEAGRKGSKVPVQLGAEQLQAFADVKKALLRGLKLQVVNPDRPYVLRVDASGKAVGAVLEQHPNAAGRPTPENSKPGMTVPVAFMSRKLTDSQQRVWDVREKEAYAILLALEKWSSWIGLQPVLILSDHETLKSWAREHLQVPAGPTGRRVWWH